MPHASRRQQDALGVEAVQEVPEALALARRRAASSRPAGRRRRPRTTRPRCGRPSGWRGCRRSRGRGRRGTAQARAGRCPCRRCARCSSTTSDSSAFVVQILRPWMRQPPLPSGSARVVMRPVSVPASGSVTPNATWRSPAAARGRNVVLQPVVAELHDRVEPEHREVHARSSRSSPRRSRAISCSITAASVIPRPPPPYSSGMAMPSQPPSAMPRVEVPRELVLAVAARPVVVVEPGAHVADRLRDQRLVVVEQLVVSVGHERERTGASAHRTPRSTRVVRRPAPDARPRPDHAAHVLGGEAGPPTKACTPRHRLADRWLLGGGLLGRGLLRRASSWRWSSSRCDFFAAAFLAVVFFAAAFLAVVVFTAAFLAGAFFAGRLPVMHRVLERLQRRDLHRAAGRLGAAISSPVCGLRPMRAGLAGTSRRANLAKPLIATASPFETVSVITSMKACNAASAVALVGVECARRARRRVLGGSWWSPGDAGGVRTEGRQHATSSGAERASGSTGHVRRRAESCNRCRPHGLATRTRGGQTHDATHEQAHEQNRHGSWWPS